MFIIPTTIGPPATLTLEIRAPVWGADLSTATSVTTTVLRRDGTQTTWTWSIKSQTPRELVAQYTFVGGELTGTGAYYLAPVVAVPGGSIPAETISLFVTTPFDCQPKQADKCWLVATTSIPAPAAISPASAATVSRANTPYAVKLTDRYVDFDTSTFQSGDPALTATLPTPLFIGQRVSFTTFGWATGAPPPVVSAGTSVLEPYAVLVPVSKGTASSTVITDQGVTVTYEWNGSRWILLA